MLDPGSQSNIITKEILRKLKLKSHKVTIPINGIDQTQIMVKESVVIHIRSMHSEFSTDLNCLIIPNNRKVTAGQGQYTQLEHSRGYRVS